ncbi:MAG: FAD-binding oxidoreductase [Synechococcus sp.]
MSHSPMDRKELIALVRHLHQTATPWIPSGLGTRLDWGAPIHADHPTVSCRGLNRVIDHAIDDLTITVEAGLPLQELQALLAAQGQWLPVDWPWGGEPSGSIGGLVARGMAGGLRQRHLGVRDQIIGIGLLRSDGIEAHAGGRVVKNVAGYDLMRLLCGSWGSLALITELTLRVQPMRPSHGTVILHGPLNSQERCRADVLRSSLTPERIDWIQSNGEATQLRLLVSSVSDVAVETQLSRIKTMAEQHGLSVERHADVQPLDAPIPRAGGRWLVRVMVPPARLHVLLSSNEYQALKGWSWCLAAGAGIGDGWAADNDTTAAHSVAALRQRLETLGGRLTVLRQLESSNQRLPAWGDAPAKAVIEAVKRQFDPQQQLCRGRLPGVEA